MTHFKQPNNLRGLQVKYLGCTNYRGSRVRITDTQRDGKPSVVIPFDHSCTDSMEIATNYLRANGFVPIAWCYSARLILVDDFMLDLAGAK